MRNKASFYVVTGLLILAAVGIVTSLIKDPSGFLKLIAGVILVGAVVYFLVNRFTKAGPKKHEQRAFMKAAKKSKKRFQHKEPSTRGTAMGSLTSIRKKKKNPSHLTVIEGKKGKKKNRATF
ncbi:SA1362 family protein [Mesobacillus harenae]|uniref:SA1362 family protein n=1 Tax=Mesobacillus harenae TaxID=2213203 RepID=UPI0015802776